MRKPEVQERMRALANRMAQMRIALNLMEAELRMLARQLDRKPSRYPRAKPVSRPMTPEIGASMRRMKAEHPEMPLRAIGRAHSVDQGRASEQINGKRK